MAARSRETIRTRAGSRDQLSSRQAQVVGAFGFLAAALLPFALWHRVIIAIAAEFRMEIDYLVTGWTAFALIVLGLLFFVPVVISIGRDPESRFYPRGRNAYMGWGVTLYVLGLALATQVAQIADGYGS